MNVLAHGWASLSFFFDGVAAQASYLFVVSARGVEIGRRVSLEEARLDLTAVAFRVPCFRCACSVLL